MGCGKLNITDFFRFAEIEKIIHHEVTDLCFTEQKINSWWSDNAERIQLRKQLLRIEAWLDLVYSIDFRSDVLNKVLTILNRYKLAVQYQLQMDLLGKRNNLNNDNPYSFVGNNVVNDWDELFGLP